MKSIVYYDTLHGYDTRETSVDTKHLLSLNVRPSESHMLIPTAPYQWTDPEFGERDDRSR